MNGNVRCWSSSGSNSFRGSRKSTPYAAQISAEVTAKRALEFGMKEIEVFVAGPGMSRESAIRALQNNGLQVTSIKDVSGIPHNGCRPPKRRRV
jgi:small subunit ribosomal protein S11